MLRSETAPGRAPSIAGQYRARLEIEGAHVEGQSTAASARAVTVPARKMSEVKVCELPIAYRW